MSSRTNFLFSEKNRRARPVSPSINKTQVLPPNGAIDMTTKQPSRVFRHLRRAALVPDGGGMTDCQLLECFISRRDEAAAEALVRRHGAMVLGVCQRVLRNPHDAEDAFQATFLVLVRKAASIRQRELLGNWLYGVAYRTALEARAVATRRRARERQVSVMPEPGIPSGADLGRDLRPLLDQELSRLPEKYQVPVILCDLEGRTRREVARQLGIPPGTLSGRLTTARRILAKRLARHGLAISGTALLTALAAGAASAGVPAPLVAATVEATTAVAAGQAAATVVSAKVAALTQGVMKAMFVTKLKIATAVLLAAGTVIGAAWVAYQPIAAQPPSISAGLRTQALPADEEAKVAAAPRILKLGAGQRGRRVAWSPDGKTLLVVTKYESPVFGRKGSAVKLWDVEKGQVRQTLAEDTGGGLAFQQVVFSADGKTIAATVSQVIQRPDSLEMRDVVKVWDAKTLALRQTLGGDSQLACVAVSPDGKRLAAGDPGKKIVMLWNAETGARERILTTGEAQPWSVAFSPDGKTLVVGGQKGDHSGVITLWNAETGKLMQTLERERFINTAVFSANGKMIASGGGGGEVELWDVENGKRIASLPGHEHGTRSVAFSPDGRVLAAGGPDGKVRVWVVQTGKLRETLEGHGSEVHSVAFSPDGQTLASTSQDQTIRLWRMGKRLAEEK
jgi:RNA polymerase sigma factor (sigma-70 family)